MDAFIGEIRPFAFSWAPADWVLCNGQTLYIPQYQTLYAVIGNTYGGNVQASTFQVPNLMGSAIVGTGQQPGGQTYNVGDAGGQESVTIDTTTFPNHSHTFNGATGAGAARTALPADNSAYLSNIAYTVQGSTTAYGTLGYVANPPSAPNITLHPNSISSVGGAGGDTAGPHENRQPYLVVGYYICAIGYFPTRP